MWLKKLLLLFAPLPKAKPIKKTKRKLCEESLHNLNTDSINYSIKAGKQTIVSVRYKTIEEYTQRIREAQLAIKKSQPIPGEWISPIETSMSLDQFMVTKDGFYLDIPLAITNFKKEALNLCQLIEESDTATVGFYEHCGRVLTPLFINVTSITKSINEVSHQ